MSCGEPHETDCNEVLDEVYLYLDLECADGRREVIREHLDECSPCLREFGIEQEVKALVSRCCGDETAPEELRSRLHKKLSELSVEAGTREYLPTDRDEKKPPSPGVPGAAAFLPAQLLGRLPWLAALFLRAFFLRDFLAMAASFHSWCRAGRLCSAAPMR